MSAKTIPAMTIVICDGCGEKLESTADQKLAEEGCRIQMQDAGGSTIRIQAKGLKEQGHPIQERMLDLCPECWPPVQEAMKTAIKTQRRQAGERDKAKS